MLSYLQCQIYLQYCFKPWFYVGRWGHRRPLCLQGGPQLGTGGGGGACRHHNVGLLQFCSAVRPVPGPAANLRFFNFQFVI